MTRGTTSMTTLGAKTHRQRAGGPNRPRTEKRKSFRGALPRSAAVPRHCLTYGERTTGPVGPSRSPGEKGGRAKREKKTGCRCVLRFRLRRQRNDKRFAPCLTTFRFSFHGLYTSGALVKPSRSAVSLALSPPVFSISLLARWFTVAYAPRCFHSLPLSLSRGRNSREKPALSAPPAHPAGPLVPPFF